MTSGSDAGVGRESLVRGYSGRVFLLVALGVMVANLGRQALPPLLPAIIDGLAITPAAAGFALTVMRVCFAVLQYPSGRIADEVSRKVAIVAGLVVMIAGFVVLTQVPTYPVFVLSTALLGIGSAFFFVSERVLLSDLFVEKRGSPSERTAPSRGSAAFSPRVSPSPRSPSVRGSPRSFRSSPS